MRIVLLVLVLAAGLGACNNKDNIPYGILPKDKMQAVLWDVMQAETYTGSYVKMNGSKNLVMDDAKFMEQIFSIHHISKDDFYKSYDYYKEHSDLLVAVLDSITVQENRNENTRLTLKAKTQAKIDSIKAKAQADSIKANGLKNKNLSLNQKLIPLIDSVALKSKQKAKLKSTPKKLPHKHRITPAIKSN